MDDIQTQSDVPTYEIPQPLSELPEVRVSIRDEGVNGGAVNTNQELVIPQGKLLDGSIVDIIAIYEITMTVDDWGSLSIDGKMVIDMTAESGGSPAGPHGGHEEWEKTASIQLASGSHDVRYEATNVPMPHPEYNQFVCEIVMEGRWQWLTSERRNQTNSKENEKV